MKNYIIGLFVTLLTLVPSISSANSNYCTQKQCNLQNNQREGIHRQKKFDPEQYQRDLEAFITKHAHLTEQEAQKFFPLFREMQQKTRTIFFNNKKPNPAAFSDNKAALEAIESHDTQEIKIKKLQQEYHRRFLKVLPATKVLMCIYAEDMFNKNMMRNIGKH